MPPNRVMVFLRWLRVWFYKRSDSVEHEVILLKGDEGLAVHQSFDVKVRVVHVVGLIPCMDRLT
jgi:hypothetical protein